MSDTPSVKKNFAYSTIYQIMLIIMPFITAPYLSRVLGSDMIGIQSYTESVQAYFLLIAALGTSTYGAKEIAQHRDDVYERSKLFWEIEIMTVFTSTAALAAWILLIAAASRYKIYYIAMIPCIFASMFDISWFYRGLEKFRLTVSQSILFLLLELISMFLFVKTKSDLLIYIIIVSVTKLLTSISLWRYLPSCTVTVDFRKLKFQNHFRQTLFYFVPTIATSIYTVLDRTLLGLFTSDSAQNGYYFQAERIISVAKSISFTAINSVVGVRISYLFSENKYDEIHQRIDSSLNYILFMSIGSACGITVIAHNFVPLFLGDEFASVEYLLYILCPIITIIGISNCLGSHYYTPSGRRAQSTKYLIAGSITNFVLNLILIPGFYAFGAAVASIIAELTITVLYVANSDGYMPLKLLIMNGWKKLLAGMIMIAVVMPFGFRMTGTNRVLIVGWQMFLGVVIYTLSLILLRDRWIMTYVRDCTKKLGGKINGQ